MRIYRRLIPPSLIYMKLRRLKRSNCGTELERRREDGEKGRAENAIRSVNGVVS